jgi:putative transcriptional regulator
VVGRTKQTRIYRREIAGSVHEMMEGVYDVGLIDKQTMRAFDEACLSPALPMAPEEIKAIREQEHVSQPVFARYLNVSENLVSDWERSAKRPDGPAQRLLAVVRKNGLRAIA